MMIATETILVAVRRVLLVGGALEGGEATAASARLTLKYGCRSWPHPQGAPMGRFPEAEARLLKKKICMNCYARNPLRSTRCRKCNCTQLRPKAVESRGV
ncbi:MAG: 50S ribosomal protein L40e [Thermoplasmatota archaeon]